MFYKVIYKKTKCAQEKRLSKLKKIYKKYQKKAFEIIENEFFFAGNKYGVKHKNRLLSQDNEVFKLNKSDTVSSFPNPSHLIPYSSLDYVISDDDGNVTDLAFSRINILGNIYQFEGLNECQKILNRELDKKYNGSAPFFNFINPKWKIDKSTLDLGKIQKEAFLEGFKLGSGKEVVEINDTYTKHKLGLERGLIDEK